MSDVISDDCSWADDKEVSVVVESLLPHKALVKEQKIKAEQFFKLMELKYGGVR